MEATAKPVPPSWLRLVNSENVGEALPSSGLTLLELGTRDGKCHAHWPTAVLPLVIDLLRAKQPVFFVECGGYGDTCSGEDVASVASAAENSDLLCVHVDEDLVVQTPPIKASAGWSDSGRVTVDGRLAYSCHVPTLTMLQAALRQHDGAHGTSTVILDEVELMRPYWEVTDEHGEIRIRVPEVQADGWRATDLLTFAEDRATPTVLVSDRPHNFSGRAALLDVALAHAVVTWTSGSHMVEVSYKRRVSLVEPWPSGIELRVRTYEPR